MCIRDGLYNDRRVLGIIGDEHNGIISCNRADHVGDPGGIQRFGCGACTTRKGFQQHDVSGISRRFDGFPENIGQPSGNRGVIGGCDRIFILPC